MRRARDVLTLPRGRAALPRSRAGMLDLQVNRGKPAGLQVNSGATSRRARRLEASRADF